MVVPFVIVPCHSILSHVLCVVGASGLSLFEVTVEISASHLAVCIALLPSHQIERVDQYLTKSTLNLVGVADYQWLKVILICVAIKHKVHPRSLNFGN